jgi:hypothetical protein
MSSPTQRSLQWLRDRGWLAHVVERRIPYKNITVDCFGGDILAVHALRKETALIQTTSASNANKRIAKCTEAESETGMEVQTWIEAGNKFFVHGWGKTGPRGKKKEWEVKITELKLSAFNSGIVKVK